MRSSTLLRRTLVVAFLPLACLAAVGCTDDEEEAPDNGSQADASTPVDSGTDSGKDAGTDAGPDTATDAPTEAAADAQDDVATDTSTDAEVWPPASLHADKVCTLPACDLTATSAVDTSGNWAVTTTTVSTDCNAIVRTQDPRFAVGYRHTGSTHALRVTGTCDRTTDGTTVVGVFHGASEATCEAKAQTAGVTEVDTSVITFAGDGTASGDATVSLYDLPAIAGQAGNACTITMSVRLERLPDCANDVDCDDSIACTQDSCDKAHGICVHALDANTCLVEQRCVADGALDSTTGDGSCHLCVGHAPSQYGWVVLSTNEACDDGNANTTNDVCTANGTCVGTL